MYILLGSGEITSINKAADQPSGIWPGTDIKGPDAHLFHDKWDDLWWKFASISRVAELQCAAPISRQFADSHLLGSLEILHLLNLGAEWVNGKEGSDKSTHYHVYTWGAKKALSFVPPLDFPPADDQNKRAPECSWKSRAAPRVPLFVAPRTMGCLHFHFMDASTTYKWAPHRRSPMGMRGMLLDQKWATCCSNFGVRKGCLSTL
jgi:hypothetical protein